MNRLGLEMLSALGLPPVELARLAAELGCAHISTGPMQMPDRFNPLGHPQWSLKDDPAYVRELKAVLMANGVSISLGEGFAVRPGVEMCERAAEMDIFAELGTRGLGAVSMEPDHARALDQFAVLAEMTDARGMLATIEFAPIQAVASFTGALAVVRQVNRSNFGLLIDAMHFFRTGHKVDDLAAIEPALIRYAQLCDAPAGPAGDNYMAEAMFARRVPGEGELPLAKFVAALPREVPLGLEVPNLAAAQAGESDRERLGRAVGAALAIISD